MKLTWGNEFVGVFNANWTLEGAPLKFRLHRSAAPTRTDKASYEIVILGDARPIGSFFHTTDKKALYRALGIISDYLVSFTLATEELMKELNKDPDS